MVEENSNTSFLLKSPYDFQNIINSFDGTFVIIEKFFYIYIDELNDFQNYFNSNLNILNALKEFIKEVNKILSSYIIDNYSSFTTSDESQVVGVLLKNFYRYTELFKISIVDDINYYTLPIGSRTSFIALNSDIVELDMSIEILIYTLEYSSDVFYIVNIYDEYFQKESYNIKCENNDIKKLINHIINILLISSRSDLDREEWDE